MDAGGHPAVSHHWRKQGGYPPSPTRCTYMYVHAHVVCVLCFQVLLIYVSVRVLVSTYLFLSAVGHFMYFNKSADFSPRRFCLVRTKFYECSKCLSIIMLSFRGAESRKYSSQQKTCNTCIALLLKSVAELLLRTLSLFLFAERGDGDV